LSSVPAVHVDDSLSALHGAAPGCGLMGQRVLHGDPPRQVLCVGARQRLVRGTVDVAQWLRADALVVTDAEWVPMMTYVRLNTRSFTFVLGH
jgi:hypothetical protein